MKHQKKKPRYYNWSRAFSYGALFLFIFSERGLGKTFGLLITLLKQIHYNDKKVVMLTKFINEIECDKNDSYPYSIYTTLLEICDLIPEIRDLDLQIELNGRHILINEKIAFSFYALNEAEKMKKLTDLKTYDIIVHDEAIRFDRYAKNEIDKLFTIYDTVDRRANNTMLICMGNTLTRFNPYFDHLHITYLDEGYIFRKEQSTLIHLSNDLVYQEERANSAITKLAGKNSNYSQMASNAKFVYDNDDYVCETIEAFDRHIFGLLIGGKEITLSRVRNGYYLHTKAKAVRYYHHKQPSLSSVPITKEKLSQLKIMFLSNYLFFQTIEIKNNFLYEYLGLK